ncbi:MAG: aminodeoxychorismate synthase component I [Chryseolinea sp.]
MMRASFISEMNSLGRHRIPFLFIVDFALDKPLLLPLHRVNADNILFDVNGKRNYLPQVQNGVHITLEKMPITLLEYKYKFDAVFKRLEYGDSFLTNLTIKTEVKPSTSLRDIFYQSHAKYKLLYENQFLVFSPETFIQIKTGKIYSFPMKGTIDAALPNARESILNDPKELSEHVTIVDLIRNDLSQVSRNVHVQKFRYVDEVKSKDKILLQVSSSIVGDLEDDYHSQIGDILVKLLPAGSVSGAPKTKTVEIIGETELEERGYYTGVFGLYDGEAVDSGVMIRFIEHDGEKYFYRSGGGITTQSTLESEYLEALDKVYVPIA